MSHATAWPACKHHLLPAANHQLLAAQMVDVGCGIGGSSRHIARKYSASARGITLSPVQAGRANSITEQAGLGERVSYQVADALAQPFDDGSFDLVWSLESGACCEGRRRSCTRGVGQTADRQGRTSRQRAAFSACLCCALQHGLATHARCCATSLAHHGPAMPHSARHNAHQQPTPAAC